MTFTTLTFFLFTLLTWVLYWLLPSRRLQNTLLLVCSYIFYGWWSPEFCLLMFWACSFDFCVSRLMEASMSERNRRILLWLSVASNMGILGYFKYRGFFLENLHQMSAAVGWSLPASSIDYVLPVGISFYTFQTMSYVIDVYRRTIVPANSWLEYLAFISFFPQLVAGPIERAGSLLPQFQAPREFDSAAAIDGCRMILWGLFKKMVVADGLSVIVQFVYGDIHAATGPQILLATFVFAFQIYFDFSAYSEIAIGTANLFGFRLSRNFAYPYFSRSLSEFWRRWHISLSTWFCDYVFIPLGGSRNGRFRTYINLVITFLVSGLWHGASWNFIIWGGLMGLGVATEGAILGKEKRDAFPVAGGESLIPTLKSACRMLFVFSFICLGWVFFRSATLTDAIQALASIASSGCQLDQFATVAELFGSRDAKVAIVFLPITVICEWCYRRELHPLVACGWSLPLRWGLYTAVLWLTLLLGPRSESQFLYFQF